MKLRLLNAGHQALGFFAYLAGYRFVDEAMRDPLLRRFVRAYLDEEGTPAVPAVPGIDLDEYKEALMERFWRPAVRDTLARLGAEGSDRIPKFLLPVIRERLAAGGD